MFPQTDGKRFLLIIIAALVIAGVCVAAVVLPGKDKGHDLEPMPIPGARPVVVNDEVVARVNADVVAAVGQPIEGTEPFMMMKAYPGLILTDFESVQAQGGVYHVLTGTLQLTPREGAAVSSADNALTSLGIMQVLTNAAVRFKMPSYIPADFWMVIDAIKIVRVGPNGHGTPLMPAIPNSDISVTGNYVCLPHRDTSGPQTMECAFGLKVGSKPLYYALDFGEMQDDSWQSLEMQSSLTIRGMFVPAAALSSNMWQIYPIEGIIRVKTVTAAAQ